MGWDEEHYPYQFAKRHKGKIVLLIIVVIGLVSDVIQPNMYQGILGQSQSTNSNLANEFPGTPSQGGLAVNQSKFIGTWKNTTLGVDIIFTFTNDTFTVENPLGSQSSSYEVLDYMTLMITPSGGQSENISYRFMNDSVLLIAYQGAIFTLNKIS
jgi:hypothetical protein